ncbi:MAG: hypothetical protein IJO34_04505 [Akkermansia sp.]|nr:hypothetical protein [Akkermansia sp.]
MLSSYRKAAPNTSPFRSLLRAEVGCACPANVRNKAVDCSRSPRGSLYYGAFFGCASYIREKTLDFQREV